MNYKKIYLFILIFLFLNINIKSETLLDQIDKITYASNLEKIDLTKITDAEKDKFIEKVENLMTAISADFLNKIKELPALKLSPDQKNLYQITVDLKRDVKKLENIFDDIYSKNIPNIPDYFKTIFLEKIIKNKAILSSDFLNKIKDDTKFALNTSQKDSIIKIIIEKELTKVSKSDDFKKIIDLADQLSTSLNDKDDKNLKDKFIQTLQSKKNILNSDTIKNLLTNSKIDLADKSLDGILKDIIEKELKTISNSADFLSLYESIEKISTTIDLILKNKIFNVIKEKKNIIDSDTLNKLKDSSKLALSDNQKKELEESTKEKEDTSQTKVSTEDKKENTPSTDTSKPAEKTETKPVIKTIADILKDIETITTKEQFAKTLEDIQNLTSIPPDLIGTKTETNKFLNKIYQNAQILPEDFIKKYQDSPKQKFTADEKSEIYLNYLIKKSNDQKTLADLLNNKLNNFSQNIIDKIRENFEKKVMEIKEELDKNFIYNFQTNSKLSFNDDKKKELQKIIDEKMKNLQDLDSKIDMAKDEFSIKDIFNLLIKNKDVENRSDPIVQKILENFYQKSLTLVSLNNISSDTLTNIKDNTKLSLQNNTLKTKYDTLISFWINIKNPNVDLKNMLNKQEYINVATDQQISENIRKNLKECLETKIKTLAQDKQTELLKILNEKLK